MTNQTRRLLSLARLWARKSGAIKRKLMVNLRLASDYLKSLRASGDRRSDRIRYGEREFSLDETPAFRHFKMHRPSSMRCLSIPCMNPPLVDFDDDDDDGLIYNADCNDGDGLKCEDPYEVEEEEGIDVKAEEFIANFYEQMKLQHQVSLIQYNEMLYRGAS